MASARDKGREVDGVQQLGRSAGGGMSDGETTSYRKEQGKQREKSSRERMGEVPLGFSTIGVVGSAPPEEPASPPSSRERELQAVESPGESQHAERPERHDEI